ncbi:MAG: 3-dehydroquinate synthase [Phycisphaerales bacterium]|nr:3-dehydroquinate synthase [Phycisphaerales bacterium]MBT7171893.1 3-dehydroquinate synthase [Phycisphaerales bacterium]
MDFPNTIHQRFSVEFDYPVHFARGVFDPACDLLAKVFSRRDAQRIHRVVVCLDEGLAAAQPELAAQIKAWFHAHNDIVELASGPILLPGGPAAKTSHDVLRDLMWTLGNVHLDRQSFVLAIGGGSMLDAAGMAVSLVHRGLRLVRMPSTTLAQNDAGVGVKNGVDEHGQKNFLGTFAPPFAVVNDLDLLNTLPDDHWRGGISEAFKVALICDKPFFEFLTAHADALAARDSAAMETLVRWCAAIHLNHIATSGDPFEFGTARPLDFGHWSAHRLEIASDHAIPHGLAVGIGIALDCCYARRKGLLTEAQLDSILDAMTRCGLPIFAPELAATTPSGELDILVGLEQFREHLGGELTITLPDSIGQRTDLHHLNPDWIVESVADLAARSNA